MAEFGGLLLSWLVTAWLHAMVLLAAAWSVERAGLVSALPARELLWRAALILPLLSASLATSTDRAAWRWNPAATAAWAARDTLSVHNAADTAPGSASRIARTPANPTRPSTDAPSPALGQTAPLGAQVPSAQAPTLGAAASSLLGDARWPLLIGALWTALALLTTALAVQRLRRFRRRLATLPPPDDATLQRTARWIARRAGLDALRLAQDPGLSSPVAVAPATVGVPSWAVLQLNRRQQAAMLSHEVAHLLRRDPQWRLQLRSIAALLPTPLTALALRRLDDLAELQCDDWAARTTGNRRALAECLAVCLEHGRDGYTPEFAVPMAVAQSPLVERVRRLVEEQTMSSPPLGLLRRIAIVGVLAGVAAGAPHVVFGSAADPSEAAIAVVPAAAADIAGPAVAAAAAAPVDIASPPAAPAFPAAEAAPPAPPAPPTPPAPLRKLHGVSSVTDLPFFGQRTTIELRGSGYALDVHGKGEFSFNDAEDGIATLDDALEIEEQENGITRWVRFEKSDGRIVSSFRVDGSSAPDDAAARQWLARVIPAMLRATGNDAEARVGRIFGRGGADAVLDEVALIGPGSVRASYLQLLFAQAKLDRTTMDRAIALATTIDSDYDMRTALASAMGNQSLEADSQRAVYRAAAAFESDYERRQLLEAALPQLERAPQATDAWLAALDSATSGYEHRVALEALVDTVELDAPMLARMLASAERIDSDYELRIILAHAAAQVGASGDLAQAYARTAASIDSDYEAREALMALIEAMQPTTPNCLAVLDTLKQIDSDHEVLQVLTGLAQRMPNDAALIERYRAAARTLGSYERSEAEQALDRFFES